MDDNRQMINTQHDTALLPIAMQPVVRPPLKLATITSWGRTNVRNVREVNIKNSHEIISFS